MLQSLRGGAGNGNTQHSADVIDTGISIYDAIIIHLNIYTSLGLGIVGSSIGIPVYRINCRFETAIDNIVYCFETAYAMRLYVSVCAN